MRVWLWHGSYKLKVPARKALTSSTHRTSTSETGNGQVRSETLYHQALHYPRPDQDVVSSALAPGTRETGEQIEGTEYGFI